MIASVLYGILGAAIFVWIIAPLLNRLLLRFMRE